MYKGQSGQLNLDGDYNKKVLRVRNESIRAIRSCNQRFVKGYLRRAGSWMNVLSAFGGKDTNVQTSYFLSPGIGRLRVLSAQRLRLLESSPTGPMGSCPSPAIQ